jgi:citrate synthase
MGSDTVKITFKDKGENKSVELPLLTGSEKEQGIDISTLRQKTGLITLDAGYMNTGACQSSITFIDGEKGVLRYRGIPIEVLADKADFLETAYLLVYGELPSKAELSQFTYQVVHHTMLHEDFKRLFEALPKDAHPMGALASAVAALSTFYHDESGDEDTLFDINCIRLIAKIPTMIAYAYKRSVGQPFVYPDNNRSYCENFLHMMFKLPVEEYQIEPEVVSALNLLLIMHADHEQNCSTSAVRLVRSSLANLYASITSGICALWGIRHGGANQEVLEMLQEIRTQGGNVKVAVEKAKDKNSGFRLMGFGHRVYKNFDPRAKIIKNACDRLLKKLKVSDPLLDIAKELEEAALKDPYFVERKLYPNVDFYSGIMYKAMGIPVHAMTAMFALGRLPGWIAHARELDNDPANKICRPRQIYVGQKERGYTEINKR